VFESRRARHPRRFTSNACMRGEAPFSNKLGMLLAVPKCYTANVYAGFRKVLSHSISLSVVW
jgi:hypothetical protein